MLHKSIAFGAKKSARCVLSEGWVKYALRLQHDTLQLYVLLMRMEREFTRICSPLVVLGGGGVS